jgi:hypothetical protein
MDVRIGELERVDVGEEDVELWHAELIVLGDSQTELNRAQGRLERLAEARFQVVAVEGAEEFDPGERVVFFSLAPRTLDLRQELEEFIAVITAPVLEPSEYPLTSPFDLFGADPAIRDNSLGL